MAEEPIKGEQIIQPDWAANATKSANEFDAAIQKLIQHTGVLAKSNLSNFQNNNPQTVADINAQTKAVEANTKIEKQNLEVKILAQQANKRVRDEIQASLSSYSKLSLEYRKAQQAAKDLAAADILQGKAFSATTKEAIAKATGLNNQLKSIDQSMGNYQRNVGNYHGAIQTLAKGFGGLTGLIATLGNAFGINTQALITLTDVSRELIKTSRELSHTQHLEILTTEANTTATVANTTALEVETVATEAQTVATEELSVATKAASGWIGAVIAAVGIGIVALAAWATGQSDTKEATKKTNEELETQKDLLEQIATYGRKKFTTQEVFEAFKTSADTSTISLTEMRDALNAIKKESEDFTKSLAENEDGQIALLDKLSESELLAIDNGESWIDVANKHKDALSKTASLIQAQIDLIDGDTKATKEKNEVKQKEIDLELEQLELQNKLYIAGKKEQELWESEHTAAAKLIEDLKVMNDESQRRLDLENKIAGHAGGISDSPKAKTQKELDETKKANLEKLASFKAMDDEIFKSASDRIKREQDLNKQNLSEIDKGLDQQLQLLIAGQSNIYDAMLKEKAKALEEQKRLEKKAAKEKEAQQLTEIFLEFLKADISAGGGKNGFNAAAKALAQTILAKGIASGLSGFFDGTEDTGTGGAVDSKGGMLAVLHPHERVLTAKQNAMIGGLSNEELVNSVMNYKIPTDKSRGQNVIDAQNSILISELKELNNTIKNKKELEVNWNRLNEIILTNKQNGYTVETTYKNSKIVNRESPFKNGRIN